MNTKIPLAFNALMPFVERWALPTEHERHSTRLASTFEELKIFYEAMLPRMEKIIAHLDQFDFKALPYAEQNLFWLALSFIEVSPAIELFGAPVVPDGFDPERFKVWM